MRLRTLSLNLHLHHLTAPPETLLKFPLYISQYHSSHVVSTIIRERKICVHNSLGSNVKSVCNEI